MAHFDHLNERKDDVVREVQQLEDAYAEAFADEVDARSLANVWEHIKELREADENERGRSGNEPGGR